MSGKGLVDTVNKCENDHQKENFNTSEKPSLFLSLPPAALEKKEYDIHLPYKIKLCMVGGIKCSPYVSFIPNDICLVLGPLYMGWCVCMCQL